MATTDDVTIATSTEIYDALVTAYNMPGEILDYVRGFTSVEDAIKRAEDAKSYADTVLAALGSSATISSSTFSDVQDAMKALRANEVVNLVAGPPLNSCKPGERYDPITQTCVPA